MKVLYGKAVSSEGSASGVFYRLVEVIDEARAAEKQIVYKRELSDCIIVARMQYPVDVRFCENHLVGHGCLEASFYYRNVHKTLRIYREELR